MKILYRALDAIVLVIFLTMQIVHIRSNIRRDQRTDSAKVLARGIKFIGINSNNAKTYAEDSF
jgi:hypothetical protein